MTKEGMGDEAMKKSLFYRAKKMPPSAQIMLLFAVEGVFLQYITSINGFGLNLYATNMGATDSQIGIIQMVPNIVACAALLPLGILADHLKSTKTIPLLTLLMMCAGYAFLGSVPVLGERRMDLFFVSLAFTAGALAIYNAQWQAMFGAAVSLRQRNDVYAFRNQFMFVIGIFAPVICGILMGRCHTADGKLLVLRSFFYLSAVCVLLQAAAIKKIPVKQQEEGKASAEAGNASSRFSVSDLLEAITSVGKNKALRWFFVPVVFFYITWQLDWSMWYLGQVKYCKMSEMTLSICNGVFNIGQLAAVGMIAKVVRKKSPDFALIFAGIGLCFCPVIMILAPHLPLAYRGVAFIVLMTVLNAPQCAVALCTIQILLNALMILHSTRIFPVALCTIQILLNAAPEKNRSLLISLFTMITTLTNSVLPLLGVRLYTALGADLTALYRFNLIDLGVRILSTLGLVWRYQKAKKDGFLTKISD